MRKRDLATGLCVTSHHGLRLPPRDIPCDYHRERARRTIKWLAGDLTALSPPVSAPEEGER